MNEEKYNSQDIRAYLLGVLPDAEVERFDELSFTDDEFSDALKSAENDLIDAYVQGELGGAALENFKSYYLASPLRCEKVNFARAFQVFAERDIAKKIEKSVVETAESNRKSDGFFSSFRVFKNFNPIFQFGFAAALLLLILGGSWLVFNRFQTGNQIAKQETFSTPRAVESPNTLENQASKNSNGEGEIAQTNDENASPAPNSAVEKPKKTPDAEPTRAAQRENPQPPKQEKTPTAPKSIVATFLLAPPLRGNSQLKTLPISAETTDVLLKLQLETEDYAAYRVALINQTGGKNVWRSGTLKLKGKGADKSLNVNLPAKLLKPEVYSLQVSGVSADGTTEIISDYPFRIVR